MPMTRRELDQFLEAPRIAHFATAGLDGAPWVRPVWCIWEDGAFFFTTTLRARRTGADVAAGSDVAISIASEFHRCRLSLPEASPGSGNRIAWCGWSGSRGDTARTLAGTKGPCEKTIV
jgi:hypothetical protein